MLVLAAVAVLVLLAAWLCGSVVARIAGVLLVMEGLLRLVRGDTDLTVVYVLGGGLTLWLAGHWIFAVKYRYWRNTLALWAFSIPGLSVLAPLPTQRRRAHPGA